MIKAIDKWLPGYLSGRFRQSGSGATDLILTVCDHFEPFHATDKDGALQRMRIWQERLPEVQRGQHDADGVLPKHTFFYPIEQYDADVVGALERLAKDTANEVEVHLHHEGETPEQLRQILRKGIHDFNAHGFLTTDASGSKRFAFIHGNWALDDANLNGKGCGVRGELALLREEGCFADLTMPSAPHPTQCRIVNQVYYAKSTARGRSHDRGQPASSSTSKFRERLDRLLLVQGPLGPDFASRKWGVIPRIENGDLTNHNPPSVRRSKLWLDICPAVANRPEWRFVKLHTHGALERNQSVLISDSARQFHQELRMWAKNSGIRLHYASAREMANIIHAAEDGMAGDAGAFRDHLYPPPPLLS